MSKAIAPHSKMPKSENCKLREMLQSVENIWNVCYSYLSAVSNFRRETFCKNFCVTKLTWVAALQFSYFAEDARTRIDCFKETAIIL